MAEAPDCRPHGRPGLRQSASCDPPATSGCTFRPSRSPFAFGQHDDHRGRWCHSVASLNRVFSDTWTPLGIGTVNQVMNIPPWLKAMGDELGGPDAREKAPLAPKPFQAAMSSFSRRSRTGTCAAAEPKVFAPRPMTAP